MKEHNRFLTRCKKTKDKLRVLDKRMEHRRRKFALGQ